MNVDNANPALTSKAQRDDLLKHMAAACRQRWSRRNWWRKREPAPKPDNNVSQEFKFLLPKPEPQWASPVLPFSAPGLLDNHGVLLDPEKTLEETQQFLERTVSGGKNWPVFLKTEQDLASLTQTTPSLSRPKAKRCSTPHPDLCNAGKDNLTGLMEKNNISVPLDCTTKVVGFKMVDGKKHLVLKVIPSSKQGILAPRKSKGVESLACSQTPSDQTWIEHNESNNISTSNVSRNRDFLYSVTERRKRQQGDGHHKEVHTDRNTHISNSGIDFNHNVASHQSTKELPLHCDVTSNSHSVCSKESKIMKQVFPFSKKDVCSLNAERAEDCQEKALRESQENFTTSQGDSSYHCDLTQCPSFDTDSLEERCHSRFVALVSEKEQNPALGSYIIDQAVKGGASDMEIANTDSYIESCLISEFDCFSSTSRSPLKDLTESLCHFQSEVGDLLFHSSGDESTNNMDPRDSLLPIGQYECEMFPAQKGTHSTAELCQTVDVLPLTTVRHLLDGVATGLTLSSDNSTDCQTSNVGTYTGVLESSEHSGTESSIPALSIPALNRKRVVEVLLNDSQEPISKSQKPSSPEDSDITASVLHWEPVPRDVPRTLRLSPYCSSQSIKVPCDHQPVVVLNHPDTDIPEVTNIMKVVHKHKGTVQRVVLSRKTINALSEFHCAAFQSNHKADFQESHCRRAWPNATVKERISLKLRLKRVCGRRYTVVPTVLENLVLQPTFRCWFCGRLFQNQEAWVGHGQRHLMEATRGWNQLFNR